LYLVKHHKYLVKGRTAGAALTFLATLFLGKSSPVTGLNWPRGWIEVQIYPFVTSAIERGGWSAPRPGRFTPGKDPVPIVQEAEWAPGPVWTCAKNRTPTGIRSPDRPARSQSLYRLSYGAHFVSRTVCIYTYSTLVSERWFVSALEEWNKIIRTFSQSLKFSPLRDD
jgi:hypothetical protein